jgi:hypothetical protein
MITAEANAQGIPPSLALSVVEQESNFDPAVRSPKGAIGLFQLMPNTAKEQGGDPNDPQQNIRMGVSYLKKQLLNHGGDVSLALASYNAGPGAVANAGGIPQFPETQKYIDQITNTRLPKYTSYDAPQGGRGAPPPRPTSSAAPPAPPTEDSLLWKYTKEAAKTFDPRERSGRQNIAGALAGAGAAYLSGGGSLLFQAAAGVTGAALGGATEEAGEQAAHGEDASGKALLGAAATQGGQEALGQTGGWALRAGGNRILETGIAKKAAGALESMRTTKAAVLHQALNDAEDVLRTTRRTSAANLRTVRSTTGAATAAVRGTAASDLAQAEAKAAVGTQPIEQQFARTSGAIGAPNMDAAGRKGVAVLEGPFQSHMNEVGKSVETAAESGPPVDISAVKAKAQDIFDREIKGVASYFSGPGDEASEAAKAQAMELLGNMEKRGASEADRLEFLNRMKAAGVPVGIADATWETAKHPAMGVLQAIKNSPDVVPFNVAHQLKRDLYEKVSFDSPAKKRVGQITKGIGLKIRDVMTGFKPYDEATAAYERLATISGDNTLVKTARDLADTDPGALVKGIKVDEPTKLAFLKEALVDKAAAGGDAKGGQAAWDSVRRAWASKHILSGGLEKLGENLAKVTDNPEFASVFFGDQNGKAVLNNFKQMASAYEQVVAKGEAEIAATKAAGEQAVDLSRAAGQGQRATVADQGRTAVQGAENARVAASRAKSAATEQTPLEKKFAESSISPAARQRPEQMMTDAARLAFMSPNFSGFWTAVFHFLRGPSSKDLLEWSVYSPTHTQWFVQALNSAHPGVALADLTRIASHELTAAMDERGSRGQARVREILGFSGKGAPPPSGPPPAGGGRGRASTPPPRPRSLAEGPVAP